MTISIACSTGDHDRCDLVVVIDNEPWECACSCHSEAVAS